MSKNTCQLGNLVSLVYSGFSGYIEVMCGTTIGIIINHDINHVINDRLYEYQVLFGERLIWCMPSELYIVST